MKGKFMATILVDYENVGNSNGLRGVDMLGSGDTLIIFYSQCCRKIRYSYMQEIKNSHCRFRIIKLKEAGKNALDFYIASECGIVSERGEEQIAIISNDKGFQAVIDFFTMDSKAKKPQLVRAGNIETALTFFSVPEGVMRRKFLQKRMEQLDLVTECEKLEKQQKIDSSIKAIFKGTLYEDKISDISKLVNANENLSKRELYIGALHGFGRKDGTGIYRLLRDGVINALNNSDVSD